MVIGINVIPVKKIIIDLRQGLLDLNQRALDLNQVSDRHHFNSAAFATGTV
ncbi:uncharacterized protein METZ01_LOCUS396968 [marine metagenome]|uniref:Uncharacterized protein n=1 Tax=marine metagenome TaxID=408172 RepID=A0A382VC97_9ZZZZ